MNKTIRLLYGAFGLFALASCSTDDLNDAKGKYDFSDKIVMRINVQGEDGEITTRAFKDASSANFTWVDGEKLRAYDKQMQVYDEFEVKNNVFTLPQTGAKVENLDYSVVLFAKSDNISFAGWNNGKNLALVKIKERIDYAENTELKEGTVLYQDAIPMYGFPQNAETKDDGSIDVTVNMARLTGQAKIQFKNGSNSKAKAVRAISLKATDGNEIDDEAFAEISATAIGTDVSEIMVGESKFDDITEANNEAMMSGWFQAELDPENSSANKLQQVEDKTGAVNTSENKPYVIVDIPEQSMNEYTNVVYIPLVKNTYDLLLIEYTEDDLSETGAEEASWKFLAIRQDYTPGTGTLGAAPNEIVVESEMTEEAESLADIQAILNKVAKIGSDVTVKLTVKNEINVWFSKDKKNYTLTIPATMQGQKVTLDCTGPTGNEAIKGNGGPEDIFVIEAEEGAKGTLAIKGAAVLAPITANTGSVNIELSGGFYGVQNEDKPIEFTAPKLTLGPNVTFYNKPTLNETDVCVNGKVTLPEKAELTTTGDVEVTEDGEISAKISAANVTVRGKAADIEATKAVTVNSGAEVSGSVEAATATVAGEVENLTVTTNATVKNAKVGTITTTTGTVTINNEEEEGKLEKEITEIKLLGAAKVELNNGFVKKITNENEGVATAATIVSKGKSAIKEVTEASAATITSYWDGEYHSGLKSKGAYSDYANTAIYTASQLTSPNGSSTLYADIYLNTADTDYEWNGISRSNSYFNGNGHTIYNVKLSETAKGFINSATATSTNRSITNLTIDGLTAEGKLTSTGALVGTVTVNEGKTLTISGVKVKNASINGDGDSYNLGGLVGEIDGNVVIKSTEVDAKVNGYYNLGVIVGSMTGNVEIGGKDAKVSVSSTSSLKVVREFAKNASQDENAGKAGIVVGQIMSAESKLTINTSNSGFGSSLSSSSINTKEDLRYDLCRITVGNIDMYFKGGTSGTTAQYFVGYSPEAGGESYYKNTTKQNNCNPLMEDASTTTTNAYNIFE